MKKYLKLPITIFAILTLIFIYQKQRQTPETTFSQKTETKREEAPKHERVMVRDQQEFEMTKDPALGYVPRERLWEAQEYATALRKEIEESGATRGPVSGVNWTSEGPVNVGGRTRALMFDPTDGTNKRVFAGAVSGGLWKNTDITSAATSWTKVDDFLDNLALTAISYDPNNTSRWYMTTGEAYSRVTTGNGVFKSTDAGATWAQLGNTTAHKFLTSMVVRDETAGVGNGVIYMGGHEKYVGEGGGGSVFKGLTGLYRSDDGGTTWAQVFPLNSFSREQAIDHIEIDANGDLWASTGSNSYGDKGGDIYTCSSGCGTPGNWTKKYDATANGFTDVDRSYFAIAPSDPNRIYAIAGKNGAGKTDVVYVIKSVNGGTSWTTHTIPKNVNVFTCVTSGTDHFTNGQATYDLCLEVHPTDPDLVLFGGVNMYRTTDAFATNNIVGAWTGGPSPCDKVMHADHHIIIFRPGASNEVIFGNDGGVFYSTDAGNSAVSAPTFFHRVKDYNVTQFYACDIHPTTATNVYIAGAQDNGTPYFNNSSTITYVNTGDGGWCHIDQNNPAIQITAYTFNCYTYTNNTWTGNFSFDIGTSQGRFINPTAYDYVNDVLYGAYDADFITRSTGFAAGTASGTAISTSSGLGGKQATTFRVSRNTPTTLYVGTDGGKIYKILNANTASPMAPTDISSGSFPSNGWVSSIDVEKGDELHLLVTFSNYGVNSVWESFNGGTSWTSVEGNLADMPIRWGIFSPVNNDQAFLATDLGVWSTDNLNGTSTSWGSTNSALANVRCDMIQYRHEDGTTRAPANATLAVATFGRGLYTAPLANALPVELFAFDATPRTTAVALSWKTANESNNSGFEIQKSTNRNSEFSKIGWVEGSGNSTVTNSYSFDDTDVRSDITYYYRLKQIDYDGKFEFSNIISASILKSTEKSLTVHPNPAAEKAVVQLPFSEVGFAIRLFDSNGKLVKTWESAANAISHELDLQTLPKGNYVLNIQNEQIQQSAKLLIVK